MNRFQRQPARVALLAVLTLIASAAGGWAQASSTAGRTIYEDLALEGDSDNGVASMRAQQTTVYSPTGEPQRSSSISVVGRKFGENGQLCLARGGVVSDQEGTVNVSSKATAGTAHGVGPATIFAVPDGPGVSGTVTIDAMGRARDPLPPTQNDDGTTTAANAVTDGHLFLRFKPDQPDLSGCGTMNFDLDAFSGELMEIRQ